MTLALTIVDSYLKDQALLGKPISTLAKMGGLKAEQVFNKLVPALESKDLGEALKFADTGLKYMGVVDKNRLREEVGLSFIIAINQIVNLVGQGLESKENWIKRKAMTLHGALIDEAAEKQKFVEHILAEQRFNMIREHLENVNKIQDEIIDFEKNELEQWITTSN